MPQVEFLGRIHEFPDNFDNAMIARALKMHSEAAPTAQHISSPDASKALRTERTNVSARTEYVPPGGLFPELPSLDADQQTFVDTIGQIETGGLRNRFIRTQISPDTGASGSSAYGTYQVTHGLLKGTVEQTPEIFNPAEREAVDELMERQEVSLAVGGRDREKYAKGGAKHGLAKRWTKQYGFETVDEFLDAFDYGGDFGLGDDGDFQTLYESASRKLLSKHLKDANGDALEAASVWHGGPNWRKGTHKGTTEQYRSKYQKITGE